MIFTPTRLAAEIDKELRGLGRSEMECIQWLSSFSDRAEGKQQSTFHTN